MKSDRSYFNLGVAKNLLRRCWPLWIGYFVILLLVLPLNLLNSSSLPRPDLNHTALSTVSFMITFNYLSAVVTVMLMFGYLYNSRSCGMMNALPLRRGTLFLTTALTGLVPLLLGQLLAAGLTALPFGSVLEARTVPIWLAASALSLISFYGFACFCAVLTGSMLVLPAVYAVLSFTAYIAETSARTVLGQFVFGMARYDETSLDWLSPPIGMLNAFSLWRDESGLHIEGLGVLAAYAAAGLLLCFFALLLYRKRRMETAGDVVAIPILKPVFKYCLSFGAALAFADVVYSVLRNGALRLLGSGWLSAMTALLLMLFGGFLGYFAAEMLMQKTLKVFHGKWKGYLTVCLILAAFTALWECDAFGYERFIPEPERVESASVLNLSLCEEENIRALEEIHAQLYAHKNRMPGERAQIVRISYELEDGRCLSRYCWLDTDEALAEDPASDVACLQRLMNCREGILQRTSFPVEPSEQTIQYFTINYSERSGTVYSEPSGVAYHPTEQKTLFFTPAEAMDFIENALKPDAEAGTVGRYYLVDSEEFRSKALNVWIDISVRRETGRSETAVETYATYDWGDVSGQLFTDSENCLRWLREHTDIVPELEAEISAGIPSA